MEISPFMPWKLLLHREQIEASLKGDLVYPISVELDLSNTCPHDCGFCSFGTSESGGYRQSHWQTFPYPRILDLLRELKNCGVESVTFTGGGEPLMHPHAATILSHATALALPWGLVTNGLLLRDRVAVAVALGATFVRVSLDAGNDDTHMAVHRPKTPQLTQILSQMRELRRMAPRLTIGASFCVTKANWREIALAAWKVRDAGGNYLEVRPTFPTDWRGDGWAEDLSPWMDDILDLVKHAKATQKTDSFRVIGMDERFDSLVNYKKPYSECRIGPLTTVIGADARIWHCCVQRGQSFFELGSVADRPFPVVWAEIHRTRNSAKIDVGKCPRCRYDGYNALIEQAVMTDALHQAFV